MKPDKDVMQKYLVAQTNKIITEFVERLFEGPETPDFSLQKADSDIYQLLRDAVAIVRYNGKELY